MDAQAKSRSFAAPLSEPPFAAFVDRHIGPRPDDIARMLDAVGAANLDALIDDAIPNDLRQRQPLAFGSPLSEAEILEKMHVLAAQNVLMTSLLGQGYYGTHLPPVIQRNVLEDPAWYTAYTPYQAEISQGRLEALLNFQTMICDLTALGVANASLLDEATAAAEAMAMARRVSHSPAQAFFVDRDCHPQTIAVVRTRAEPLGWIIIVGDPAVDLDANMVFGALLQYPGSSGRLVSHRDAITKLHAHQAIGVVAADLLALALITPPGEFGADIAVGSVQRFGMPLGYGGPHAAYIASRAAFQRALPGRLVGVSATAAAARRCGWRCRRASSTFAARRPHRIFARLKYCPRSLPRCMASTMAPMAFEQIASAGCAHRRGSRPRP